jgi:hypothetical protein
MSVSNIPQPVRYLLWAKSAGRCEFDGCNALLWRDGLTKIEMNFADFAHIIGDSPDGPRGDVILSKQYCSDVTNIMLMCLNHHRMIDHLLETYTDDVLRQMKRAHEERMEILTAIKSDKTSYVLIYQGSIGENRPKINYRDAWLAMYPDGFPANSLPIELGLSNSAYQDYEEDFWHFEKTNLERQFNAKVKPLIESKEERNHFSVFAFAPQPLLIKLGSLLSDLYPADIYQLHKEPATWRWQHATEKFEYIIKEPQTTHSRVALNLSLSAEIDSQRVDLVMGSQPYSEWRMILERPCNDYLKNKEQLKFFRQEFRALLDRIKTKHGENAVIHIFPAVPVSVAVEIGRVRQPKADLPFVIYDQNNKKQRFIHALDIGR